MKRNLLILSFSLTTAATFARGLVNFANTPTTLGSAEAPTRLLKSFLKTYRRDLVQLVLIVLASLMLHCICARADVVYVWSNDGTLQKFSTNGVASLVTTNLPGCRGPVGLVCDNVGNVYAGVPCGNYIRRFSPDGNSSLVATLLDGVSGLAFDGTGNLYATFPAWGELTKLGYGFGQYNSSGTNYSVTHFSSPLNLAFDSAGNLYSVYNTNALPPLDRYSFPTPYNNTIQKFAPDFTYLGAFATELNSPWGIAFDSGGNLFVANSGTNGNLNNTIVEFTTNGVHSTFANASSGLSSPQGLAFDSAGNLYVANSLNGTIQKFTPNGAGSVFASGLNSPSSIAIFPGLKTWSATPIELNTPVILPGGAFQFTFIDNPGLTFTVLATTNFSSSLTNWTALGGVTEVTPGTFQFNDAQATNNTQRFYQIRSP